MKISYAITVCNELKEIRKLVGILGKSKREQDEIVILFDKGKGTPEVWSYLNACLELYTNVTIKAKTFKNHFADWKNYLTSLCKGYYIFQIDADEYPNEAVFTHIPTILESNPDNEVYLVPRVNTVNGLTQDHINKWRWNVNEKGWVNFPDYQGRIWRNRPNILWKNPVHEVLSGYKEHTFLPQEEEFCFYHHKEISKQEKQNEKYSNIK